MTSQQRERILQALWLQPGPPAAAVWAILDCARDPQIYRALLASQLEFRCLYAGRLPRELEMVAPQLVELSPGNRLALQWLDQGWGQSWGVLLRIDDPANLRHHLRKFLKVRDPQGRTLLFRYYDPRVLRAFLPAADAGQRKALFGPIAHWFTEDDHDGLQGFGLDAQGGLLRTRLVAASPQPA